MKLESKLIFLFALTALFSNALQGQSDCYSTFVSKGQELEQAGDFDNAIIQYRTARVCPNLSKDQDLELSNVIEAALEKRNNTLLEALKKTEAALREAKASALAAKARQIYPKDNTIALNLALA